MVDDRNSMTVDDYDAKETMEEDIAEGILPAQASTIAANDNKSQTLMDTYGQLQTLTDGNLRNSVTEVTAEKPQVMEPKSQTVTEVTVREPPKKELPPPLIKVKSKVIPLKIIDKPEGVIQKQPEPPLSPKKTMPAVIKATQITGTKPSPTQRTINA